METHYKIQVQIRHSTPDSWANGCELRGSSDFPDNDSARKFKTPAEVVAFIKERTRCTDVSAWSFDSCDEPGRIDVQFNSATAKGRPQSAEHAEAWKAGKAESFLIDWSFYVVQVSSPETASWAG